MKALIHSILLLVFLPFLGRADSLSFATDLSHQLDSLHNLEKQVKFYSKEQIEKEANRIWEQHLKIKKQFNENFQNTDLTKDLLEIRQLAEKSQQYFLLSRQIRAFSEKQLSEDSPNKIVFRRNKDRLLLSHIDRRILSQNLQSGDVLVSKSDSPEGSVIARQGDAQNWYTHALIFYRDKTGAEFIIDSNEFGLVVTPFHQVKVKGTWPFENAASIAAFRFQDQRLRESAAELAYEFAKSYSDGGGHRGTPQKNFPFNYTNQLGRIEQINSTNELLNVKMENNIRDNSGSRFEVYCIGLIRQMFRLSSLKLYGKPISVSPFLGTTKKREFLQKSFRIFTERYTVIDNLEIDPRMDFVFELSDPSKAFASAIKDVTVGKILDWLEGLSRTYGIQPTPLAQNVSAVVTKYLRPPLRLIEPKNSMLLNLANIPPELLQFSVSVFQIYQEIFKEIDSKIASNHRATLADVSAELDQKWSSEFRSLRSGQPTIFRKLIQKKCSFPCPSLSN